MKLKVAIILVVAAGLILGAFYMMGFRLRFGKDKLHTQGNAQGVPLATVRLLDASKTPLQSTDIRAYNGIYRALGAASDQFASWEKKNGYGSLGRDKDGKLFIPDFPIFSKVAWMYIDPVDLSLEEVRQLIQECSEVEARTDDVAVREEVSRLRSLAQEAASRSASLRFDQP